MTTRHLRIAWQDWHLRRIRRSERALDQLTEADFALPHWRWNLILWRRGGLHMLRSVRRETAHIESRQ